MAKIHVLRGSSAGDAYTVVVHIATPVGNNSAGVPWIDAIKNTGKNVSVMTVGTGAGQITQAELDQIIAGTLIEGTFRWGDNQTFTNPQRLSNLDANATRLTNELLAALSNELKFFGFTRT